jgi:hypothetical protein
VYLDFSRAINEQGREKIEEKYGNLFRMYQKITASVLHIARMNWEYNWAVLSPG